MRDESPVVRAVLYLDAGDLDAVQAWHDAAEAALLPLVQPPGAPAVDREIKGFAVSRAGTGTPIDAGDWSDAMVPGLDQLGTIWSYGDDQPHGSPTW